MRRRLRADLGDGSYRLSWKSKYSTHGLAKSRVQVNGTDVHGSPMSFQLLSTRPERSKTVACSLGSWRGGAGMEQGAAVADDFAAHLQARIKKRMTKFLPKQGSKEQKAGGSAGAPLQPQWIYTHDGYDDDDDDEFGYVGLKYAVAGERTTILLLFRDEHGNPATPTGGRYKIAMAISNSKKRVNELEAHASVRSEWGAEDTGIHTLTYVATDAGPTELTLWSEPEGDGVREMIPGSPYVLHVTAGAATAADSCVDGFQVEAHKGSVASKPGGSQPAKGGASGGGKASNAEMDSSVIIAGDVVSVRAYGYDQYGNAASMGGVDGESGGKDKSSTAKQLVGYEGDSTGRELSAKLVAPDGTEAPLSVALQAKSGKPATYDIRAETMLSGRHEVHVLLDKVPIRNSPATFVVLPSAATPHHSRLIPPANGVDNLVASLHDPAIVVLATHDKFANALASGGLRVAGRLNLVKQSASDISILTPNNNTVTIEDRNDGTYAIKVALDMTAVVKVSDARTPPHTTTNDQAPP